jgi:predicted enzyme related to lactoylglutathione lyase
VGADPQLTIAENHMKFVSKLLGVLLMTQTITANAQESGIQKFGLYVMVSDLSRAKAFYEKVFAKPPYVTNEVLTGFDVAGGLFAAYLNSARDLKTTRGNSTVAYIRVRDANEELKRMQALSVPLLDAKVVKEGPIELFRFTDPDGNLIEFFSLAKN